MKSNNYYLQHCVKFGPCFPPAFEQRDFSTDDLKKELVLRVQHHRVTQAKESKMVIGACTCKDCYTKNDPMASTLKAFFRKFTCILIF